MIPTAATIRHRQRSEMEKAAVNYSTLEAAEYNFRAGYISELEFRWFKFFWRWSEVRLSDHRHTRAWERLGTTIYHKRIRKVRNMIARTVYNEQKRWQQQVEAQ